MGLFWIHYIPRDEYEEMWRHLQDPSGTDLVQEWPQACLWL